LCASSSSTRALAKSLSLMRICACSSSCLVFRSTASVSAPPSWVSIVDMGGSGSAAASLGTGAKGASASSSSDFWSTGGRSVGRKV